MSYVPLPGGFKLDEVSSNEYRAVLCDSNLDDASVASSEGHESDVSCASVDTVEVASSMGARVSLLLALLSSLDNT